MATTSFRENAGQIGHFLEVFPLQILSVPSDRLDFVL